MPDWLELELAEALRPAAAPSELWGRMASCGGLATRPASEARLFAPSRNVSRPKARPARALWPIAAILTLMIAAGTLWLVAKGEEPATAPLARSAAVTATSTRAPEHCLLCHTSL
ncbi:MAG TPA: hypothetical protein VE959_01930 [Bryobacteraceae bacterium]|nr:hypothetical protein [Bryobacteraceae bacterium]